MSQRPDPYRGTRLAILILTSLLLTIATLMLLALLKAGRTP